MSAEIRKFPIKPSMIGHGYLNGFGWTERQCELERMSRRLQNTIAVLKKREAAVRRAIRMELKKFVRERDQRNDCCAAIRMRGPRQSG